MPEAGFDPEVAGGAAAAGARPAPKGVQPRMPFAANRGGPAAAGMARGGPIAAAHRGTRPW